MPSAKSSHAGSTSLQPRKAADGNSNKSRRDFLKAALAFSVVLVVAGVAAVTRSLWNPSSQPPTSLEVSGGSTPPSSFPRVKVGNVSDLKVNQPISFNYPLDNEPNIMVRLGKKAQGGVGPDGDIVAFSQICQHLGCIYGFVAPGTSPSCDATYNAPGPVGYCCCHGSVFDLVNLAKVMGGPSPRPQPQVILEFDGSTGDIYATGMTPPTIFGHNTGSSDVMSDLQGGTPVS
jgi:arsenite oxidase small subunit